MRLTLRTMLAYLDDILEPDDTEDIGKKIEESEFATNLVHRTRDCMRRLRLGVPALMGRGLAADPNSVAEYLDNTLAADRVGEFGKVCLESDVHLAEVASCHQILTLVLGESAEIDPESRRKVYGLAAQVDAPPVQSDSLRPVMAASSQSGSYASPARAQRVKPEVPDYLREPRSRAWIVAATVLVAALLTFGGLVFLGPEQLRQRVARLVQGGANQEAAPVDAPAAVENLAASGVAPTTAEPATGEQTEPESTTETPVTDTAATDSTDEGMPSEPTSVAEETATPADPSKPTSVANEPLPAAAALMPEKSTTATDNAGIPVPDPMPPGDTKPIASTPTDDLPATPADGATISPRTEPAVENFGRYTSKRDILLKFDPETGNWKRLAAMLPLAKGDRLLSLPLFRPVIALSSGINMQTEGAASLELVGWTAEGVPIIGIEHGRLLMATVGKAGNSLQVKLGDRIVQLTFADADAELALEVRRVLPPGKDPETEPVPLAAELYAKSGMIHVRDGEKEFDVQAPAVRALISVSGQPPLSDDFPKWVNFEAPTDSERRATTTLEPLLPTGQAAALAIKELSDSEHSVGQRREVRSLAIRSLRYLGEFDACVAALNDPKEKLSWSVYMEELRSAVAQSPDTAAKVRATFEKQRGADAAFLYRMLWGYSADDLKSGADKDLVDGLDRQDSLDYRVMSLWNLQNITGSGNLGYRPEEFAGKRRLPYNAWKERLRQHKIVPHAVGTSPRGKSASKGS